MLGAIRMNVIRQTVMVSKNITVMLAKYSYCHAGCQYDEFYYADCHITACPGKKVQQ